MLICCRRKSSDILVKIEKEVIIVSAKLLQSSFCVYLFGLETLAS